MIVLSSYFLNTVTDVFLFSHQSAVNNVNVNIVVKWRFVNNVHSE